MRTRARKLTKGLALVAAGAVLGSSLYAVAANKPLKPAKYAPDPPHSIRDTGVGLPRIDSQGTLGIGEFTPSVHAYHDSGAYDADLTTVGGQAEQFMVRQAKALRSGPYRASCLKKKKKTNAGPRKCTKKLAIVLDIDETSLSNYQELSATNFSNAAAALVAALSSADSPAIGPTLQLYNKAKAMNIAVFFVTGRPPAAEPFTRQNLTLAGFTAPDGLYMKPSAEETIPYKSNARATIEQVLGYRIIANVGDQESDLAGGYADRSFKLPNPFYFIH